MIVRWQVKVRWGSGESQRPLINLGFDSCFVLEFSRYCPQELDRFSNLVGREVETYR